MPKSKVHSRRSIIENWSDLSHVVESYSDGSWIFRGVVSADYKLTPKIGRPDSRKDPNTGAPTSFSPAEELRCLKEFIRQSRPYIPYEPKTLVEWMSIAQHHGLPTRLLDWTESALIAAYFATEKAGTTGTAAIYGIKRFRPLPATKHDRPLEINQPYTYVPPHISPRIPAQRALFTVHAQPTAVLIRPPRVKWTIPQQACFEIKQLLDRIGVNRASLFPDLDGLATHIGWTFKWGKLPS